MSTPIANRRASVFHKYFLFFLLGASFVTRVTPVVFLHFGSNEKVMNSS
jgi:hypothetical protein